MNSEGGEPLHSFGICREGPLDIPVVHPLTGRGVHTEGTPALEWMKLICKKPFADFNKLRAWLMSVFSVTTASGVTQAMVEHAVGDGSEATAEIAERGAVECHLTQRIVVINPDVLVDVVPREITRDDETAHGVDIVTAVGARSVPAAKRRRRMGVRIYPSHPLLSRKA